MSYDELLIDFFKIFNDLPFSYDDPYVFFKDNDDMYIVIGDGFTEEEAVKVMQRSIADKKNYFIAKERKTTVSIDKSKIY